MKISRTKLRAAILAADVEIAVHDADYGPELAQEIRAELDAGNEWAWCVVVVTVRHMGYEGQAWLGGVSYLRAYLPKGNFRVCEDAWRADNYEQMLAEAIEECAQHMESVLLPGKRIAKIQQERYAAEAELQNLAVHVPSHVRKRTAKSA